MLELPLNNSKISILISLKKDHEINRLTKNQLLPKSALWQQLEVQDLLVQNDILHRLSPLEASWRVTIQDVTVKRDGFLPLQSPLIRQIHSSRKGRQRAFFHLGRGTGRGELVPPMFW